MMAANTPLYQKIKNDLIGQIKNGSLPSGGKLPTEYELMEHYKVSRITVSKAMRELKDEGFIVRYPNRGSFVAGQQTDESLIHEDAGKTPEKASAQMVEIACILPSINDNFSLSMINGITSAFDEETYLIHLFQSRNSSVENYLLQHCLENGMAGIILFPQDQPFFSDQLLFMLLKKYPLVLIDRNLPHLDTSYVIEDNEAAGALCLNHLAELGHRRIVFATSTSRDTFSVASRISGVQKAAAEHSLPENAIQIFDEIGCDKPYCNYQDAFQKLVTEEGITAIITAESTTCIYLHGLLSSIGLKIPGQVSLITFDKPYSDTVPASFFTHINQSEYLMGRQAGLLLKDRLENHNMEVYHQVVAPVLELGSSTSFSS